MAGWWWRRCWSDKVGTSAGESGRLTITPHTPVDLSPEFPTKTHPQTVSFTGSLNDFSPHRPTMPPSHGPSSSCPVSLALVGPQEAFIPLQRPHPPPPTLPVCPPLRPHAF